MRSVRFQRRLWIGLVIVDGKSAPVIAAVSLRSAEKQARELVKSGLAESVVVRPYRYDELRQVRRRLEKRYRSSLLAPAKDALRDYGNRGPQIRVVEGELAEGHKVLEEIELFSKPH